jgi:putative membrane protein
MMIQKFKSEGLAKGCLPRKPLNQNRIRDHLANERTYLSWMRSAIALMGFGVLIVRLRLLRPPMLPQPPGTGWKLGLAFAVVGLLTLLLSLQQYFVVRRNIEEDTYQPFDYGVILFSLALLLLGVGVIYYVFAVPLELSRSIIIE